MFWSFRPSKSSVEMNLDHPQLLDQSHNLYIMGQGPSSSSVKNIYFGHKLVIEIYEIFTYSNLYDNTKSHGKHPLNRQL